MTLPFSYRNHDNFDAVESIFSSIFPLESERE